MTKQIKSKEHASDGTAQKTARLIHHSETFLLTRPRWMMEMHSDALDANNKTFVERALVWGSKMINESHTKQSKLE